MLERKIWKFPLESFHRRTVIGPRLSRPFSVGFDPTGELCLWGVVTPEETYADQQWEWEVIFVGTGHTLPEGATTENYVTRLVYRTVVIHVFVKRIQK